MWKFTATNIFKKIAGKWAWLALVIFAVPSYWWARQAMIDQSTSFTATISNITLNFLLFLGVYGYIVDRKTKHMPKWKGWLILFIGFSVIVLAFRFLGGFETIFG